MAHGLFSRRARRKKLWADPKFRAKHYETNKKSHYIQQLKYQHDVDVFFNRRCVICGKLTMSVRKTKHRVCRLCWLKKVHPMLARKGVYKR